MSENPEPINKKRRTILKIALTVPTASLLVMVHEYNQLIKECTWLSDELKYNIKANMDCVERNIERNGEINDLKETIRELLREIPELQRSPSVPNVQEIKPGDNCVYINFKTALQKRLKMKTDQNQKNQI